MISIHSFLVSSEFRMRMMVIRLEYGRMKVIQIHCLKIDPPSPFT